VSTARHQATTASKVVTAVVSSGSPLGFERAGLIHGDAPSRASAWERRKSAHVLDARSGAGLSPSCLRVSQTVEGATLMPSVVSSPWIRR
jgi:hypothetical protein